MNCRDLFATGSLLAFAWAGEAAAQTQPRSESVAIEEVIVTAQRREQRLQEAPVAVTAVSATAMEQQNIRDARDLMQIVPGLQIATQTAGDNGGSATFFLRGLGQERSGNGSEQAIGIYVDDFYYPTLSGSLFKIVDLAQVEVLRGPQGTLFGRNTIGGAIRYTSERPVLGAFSGSATGVYGSYERFDVSGALNVPIGERAALRLTAGHLQRDGYVEVQTGKPDAGRTVTDLVRLQFRIEPTASTYVDVSAQSSRDKLEGFTYNLPGPMTPLPPAPGAAPSVPFIYNFLVAPAAGLVPYTDALKSQCFYCTPGSNITEFSRTSYRNALVTAGWDIGAGFTLKSLTGWQRIENRAAADLDGTVALLYNVGITPAVTRAFSQEFQLNGALLDERLNFVGGLFYYDEDAEQKMSQTPLIALGSPTLPPLADRGTKSYAGYVDASYALSERLTLLGGFRYSEDHKEIVARVQPSGAVVGERSQTFDSSTYRIGLQYQWTPDVMSYANVSTGFRSGGFNPFNAAPQLSLQPFDPEKATSYEIGLRTQFLDRRLTLNPTIFYIDWTDIQIQSVVITDPASGTGGPILQNVGAARTYGLELEGSLQATDHLRLFGNLAYLNARYTDVAPATGLTTDSPLQRAPEWTYGIGGAYTWELDGGGAIVATVNYAFEDDQQSAPKTSLLLPSYGLLNGRVEFSPASGRFTIAVFGTNLTDEEYYAGGVDYTDIVGSPHYDLGRPREFGVSLKASF